MLSTFSLSDTIIGFIINGHYDKITVEEIQNQVCEKLEIYEKISLYIEDTVEAEISLKSILNGLPFKMRNANSFEKVAIVTDRKQIQFLSIIDKLFLNTELRRFSSGERLEAIQWISH